MQYLAAEALKWVRGGMGVGHFMHLFLELFHRSLLRRFGGVANSGVSLMRWLIFQLSPAINAAISDLD